MLLFDVIEANILLSSRYPHPDPQTHATNAKALTDAGYHAVV